MIKFTIKPKKPVDMLQREYNRVKKVALQAAGVWWHRTMRPVHFTMKGARKYHYRGRAGERASQGSQRFRRSYTGRKLREKGHTRPLEWSGASKTLARIQNVRATSRGVKVIMRAPTLNRPHRHGRINMRKELTTVTQDELKRLLRIMAAVFKRLMKPV